MAVSTSVLGLNARNFLYIRKYNSTSAKKVADDKLLTKELLIKNNISTPKLLATFQNYKSVKEFDWILPKNGFAIKPTRGYEGGGIMVFRKWYENRGKIVNGKKMVIKEIEPHIFDILDGAYSLQQLPDRAFIEERVLLHEFFKDLVTLGMPDIRIIVFNKIPVMAMLRLPTEKSDWKANITKGALGIGIDIRTGTTSYAVSNNKIVDFIQGKDIPTRGIKIPHWDEMLFLAALTQSVSGLGYAGIDIVLDKKKGPMVLEINARPGLGIQIANMASLRTRIERIEDLKILSPQRGVELAKTLFTETDPERCEDYPTVLSAVEQVTLKHNGLKKKVLAKLDTGAYRTSLDEDLVNELQLPVLPRTIVVRSASGEQERSAVKIRLNIQGKKLKTTATIASRGHLKYPIIIGRRDMKGFLVNPVITDDDGEENTYER